MKNTILFILVLVTSSCSTIPKSPLDLLSSQNTTSTSVEAMDRRYPYLKVTLRPFQVWDKDSTTPGATPLQNMRARQIDIKEKYNILRRVDFMRFVVNTPEFETNLLNGVYRSARNVTGSRGVIKVGDIYDNNRILELLQKLIMNTRIGKQPLSSGAAAVGMLGSSFYVTGESKMNNSAFIIFPNRDYWGEGGYNNDNFPSNIYIAGVIFHELIHNMGFNHEDPIHGNDTVYGIQNMFIKTAQDPKWQKKYGKQLASYKLYQTKYKDWLTFITTPTRVHAKQSPIPNNDTYDREYPGELETGQQGPQNEETVVCILYPDGTHKLVKMRNGRMI